MKDAQIAREPLVEKIARALCAADATAPEPDAPIYIGVKAARAWQGRVEMARACLSAIEAEGMVIVPREPTEEMADAGADADMPGGRWGEPTFRESNLDSTDARAVWAYMLAAAPKQG